MKKLFPKSKTITLVMIALVLAFSLVYTEARAVAPFDAAPGTYTVEASLSCLVTAMGGVEFGAPLLKEATVTVHEDKSSNVTLHFGKSNVNIYGVACDIFIDATPTNANEERGIKSGTIGYYDEGGTLKTEGISHTVGNDTGLNTAGKEVNYVDSITFPLEYISDTYNLTLYVNSNVMGVQFCNKNDKATTATYPAVLTINLDLPKDGSTNSADSPAVVSGNTANDAQTNESIATQSTIATSSEPVSATIVEADGLNIHYVSGSSEIPVNAADIDRRIIFSALVNERALIIIAVFAALFVIGGIVLIISSKESKKEKSEK